MTCRRPTSSPIALVALVLGLGSPLGAQNILQLDLGRPTGTLSRGFTTVTSVRELDDGTLLVADRSEGTITHIGWNQTSEPTVIGNEGNGPGDIRGVGWLYPLSGDSTLFTDSYHSRWNILVGAEIVGILSEHRPGQSHSGRGSPRSGPGWKRTWVRRHGRRLCCSHTGRYGLR